MAKPTFVGAGSGSNASATPTLAFDATGGDCLYVVTGLNTAAGTTVASVTYAGVSMTKLDEVVMTTSARHFALWRLVAPTTDSNDIVATNSPANSRTCSIQAVTLTGADQSTPDGTPSKDTDLGVDVTSVTSNQLVLSAALVYDAAAPGGDQWTSDGTNQTERTDAGPVCYISMATQTAEGTVTATFTYASTADETGIFAVAVNGATATNPAPTRPNSRGTGRAFSRALG